MRIPIAAILLSVCIITTTQGAVERAFTPLKFGVVQPRGWILEQMKSTLQQFLCKCKCRFSLLTLFSLADGSGRDSASVTTEPAPSDWGRDNRSRNLSRLSCGIVNCGAIDET